LTHDVLRIAVQIIISAALATTVVVLSAKERKKEIGG